MGDIKKKEALGFLKGKVSNEDYEYIDLWMTDRQFRTGFWRFLIRSEADFLVRISEPCSISYIVEVKGSSDYKNKTTIDRLSWMKR